MKKGTIERRIVARLAARYRFHSNTYNRLRRNGYMHPAYLSVYEVIKTESLIAYSEAKNILNGG